MALQETLQELKLRNIEAGSFTLTKLWIEKAEELELSAAAVSVMTALLWHYNPAKKYVYPHQETISKRIKRSVATVKRAIAELKQAGYVISSRTRNGNLYAFTKKFFELFELSESQICTEPTAKNELCMTHEHVREHVNNNRAVVISIKDFQGVEGGTQRASSTAVPVSSETHSNYNLDDIPEIIRKNKNIRNIKRYWGSLRPQVKIEYWQEQEKKDRLKHERVEQERLAEEKKAKERAEAEAYNKLPLSEKFNRQQAIHHIWCLRLILCRRGYQVNGLSADLVELYNLDVKQICNMTQEEVEKIVC